MGCSSSKIEEVAAVQICKDRIQFIKQAITHRNKFASSHIAYIQSLKRVPIALRTCVDEDRYRYFLDSCKNHQLIHDQIIIEPNAINSSVTVNYSRSSRELSEIVTFEPLHNALEYMDDFLATNFYLNPFLSLNEERENSIERENIEGENEVVGEVRENRIARAGGDVGEENLPGFTLHVNRIPTSIADVMKDLDVQFKLISDVAYEVAILLEVHVPNQNSIRDRMMPRRNRDSHRTRREDLNLNSNANDNEISNSNSDVSEEPFQQFKSHKATLERLYTWEKKLYDEVKEGERLRIAYDKKYAQFKDQDIFGSEPSTIDKTRSSIRDLRTKLNISITSVQSISKRIETLRDSELHPQIIDMIRGLKKLWRTIGDAHRIQKRTINEAMQLLQLISLSTRSPPPPVSLSASLASELLQWRLALASWLVSQKAYVTSLSKWAQSCVADPIDGGAVYNICVNWMKVVEAMDEEKAVEGIKSFEEVMKEMVNEGKKRKRERGVREEMEREEDWRLGFCDGLAEAVGVVGRFMAIGADEYEELSSDLIEERRE